MKASRLIFWKLGRKARLKVGTRTAAAGISSMKCISARMRARSTGDLRRETRLRRDLVEIFGDDGGIDDDRAIVVERGHHPIGIEFEIVGLELVAFEQIELHFVEWNFLCR